MINYCDWETFFGAICIRIYELSNDLENRDEKLLLIAKGAFHSAHAILQYPSLDSFSYIYVLAQRNTKNQLAGIFTKAKNVIGLEKKSRQILFFQVLLQIH
jgi:hypothetical protein